MGVKMNRETIYGDQELVNRIKKFESEQKVSIRNTPLKTLAAVDAGLISVKVLDDVIVGAEDAVVWSNLAAVHTMQAPKEEIALISPDDFKVYKGRSGVIRKTVGGGFDRIELDCSLDKGMYVVTLDLDRTWIRDNGVDKLEEALRQAGAALYLQVAKDIMLKYETDVDPAMTGTVAAWGGAHYRALVRGDSEIRAAGMVPNLIAINPSELNDIMVTDYFIHADYSKVATGLPKDGAIVGYLYGSIPIVCSRAVTPTKMTIAAKEKAMIVGVRQELTVENFEDVLNGVEGGVISFQFDVKSGKDARGVAATKPTRRAWAVITGA